MPGTLQCRALLAFQYHDPRDSRSYPNSSRPTHCGMCFCDHFAGVWCPVHDRHGRRTIADGAESS